MDRYRVIITPRAGADLERIYDRIALSSPQAARATIKRILDAFETLEGFPHHNLVQRQSPRIRHPVRSLPVRPYVVYFRAIDEDKVVRVLTVRHGARRRPRRFD
jgi:plasmid stabilization system protein ParE